MAEKRQIEVEIKDNTQSLKAQYREALQELQKVTEQYGATSEEAVKAAKAAAQLKDQIEDSKNLVDAFNPDAKFNALSGSIGGVLNGFQAYEGAMGLLGVESENLQKTMVKVQSAMALSQGLQGLMEAKDQFKNFGTVAMQALSGIKKAIGATGIGLLVVAAGALYAYWDDIKKAVSGVGNEQKKLNAEAKKTAEAAKKTYDNFQLQENSLRLQGKTEKEILKIKIDKLNTAIKTQEVEISRLETTSKLEVSASERNQKITKAIIRGALELAAVSLRLLVAPIDLVLKTANFVSEKLGQGKIFASSLNETISVLIDKGADVASKWIFDPAEVKSEGQAAINEAKDKLAQMKSDRDGFLLNMKQTNAATNKEVNSNNKTSAENNRKEILDQINKQYDDERKLANEIQKQKLQLLEDGQDKEIQLRQQAFEEYKENVLAEYTKEEKEALDKQFENGTLKEKKYREAIADLRKNAVSKLSQEEAESLKLAEELLQKDILEIKEKYQKIWDDAVKTADKIRQKQEEEFQAKIEQIQEDSYQAKLKKQLGEEEYEKELVRQKYFTLQELAKGNAEQEAILEEAKQTELDTIKEKYAQKEESRKRAELERNVGFAKQGLTIIADLTDLFGKKGTESAKKAFKIKKAAQIANALIDTYMNATAAYGSQFLPLPDVSSPVRGGIAAGLAVAAGLANVAKITAQKFEGGGGGGGGGIPPNPPLPPPSQAPTFNVIGNNGLNQLAQLQQQPTQAYVVSGQVTTAQSLDRNRIQNATL